MKCVGKWNVRIWENLVERYLARVDKKCPTLKVDFKSIRDSLCANGWRIEQKMYNRWRCTVEYSSIVKLNRVFWHFVSVFFSLYVYWQKNPLTICDFARNEPISSHHKTIFRKKAQIVLTVFDWNQTKKSGIKTSNLWQKSCIRLKALLIWLSLTAVAIAANRSHLLQCVRQKLIDSDERYALLLLLLCGEAKQNGTVLWVTESVAGSLGISAAHTERTDISTTLCWVCAESVCANYISPEW